MGKNGAALNDGSWHTMSGYVSTYYSESEYRSYDRVAFGINDQTKNDTMDVKEFMVINLTEAFGRGNEPNKSWCDNNISFFEGTTIIHQSVPGQGTAAAIKNIYVGVPKNCKLVSYIESTGTQYIDTGVAMTSNTSAGIDFQLTSIITSAHNSIITSYVDNVGTGFVFAQRSNTSNFAFAFGDQWNSTEISADLLKHTARINIDGKCYFDDQVVVDTVGSIGLSSNRNILLCGWQNGDTTNVSRFGYLKIYSCKIWKENILVRDFIPILDENNIPCLYDSIEKKFYYNAGTGTFKYGYEINNDKKVLTGKSYTPIEYAQSTGTQYIDTGFKHNQNTRMVAEIELLGGNAWINIFGSWGNTNNGDRRMMGVQCNTDGMGCVSAYYGNGLYKKWTGVTGKTTFDFNKNVYTIKGTSYTFSTASFQSLYNDYIFTASGYNGGPDIGCAQKLYSFKIYDNGRLIRDYIPVKDENDIVCLFDKISNNFYYNQGTGDLTAGPVTGQTVLVGYEPLNYVESNGTQYINTSFYANNNTHIQLKAVPTKFEEEWQCIFSSKTAYQQNEYVLQVHQTNNNWYSSYGTNDSRDVNIVLGEEYICDKNKNITNINGTTMTLDSATFTATQPGYIFADNENGACHFWRGKLYYLKIYDDTTLVRDFIPVLTQEGIVSLYDQLNNKFYVSETNNLIAGTSEFNTSVARKVRRGYVGVKNQYQELEYLESTGTQYINTGIIPTQNTRTKIAFLLTNNIQGQYAGMMGYQNVNGGGSSNYRLVNIPGSSLQFNGGSSYIGAENTERYKYYVADCSMNNFIVNGISHSSSGQTWGTASGPIYLFGRYSNESSGVLSSTLCSARLYYCKIYENNVLVRDFIPVLDDNNIPCLYDKITYKCFYNIGTGTFDYGYKLDKPKGTVLKYIESTGTQYIDTGLSGAFKTEIKVEYTGTFSTTYDTIIGAENNNSPYNGNGIRYRNDLGVWHLGIGDASNWASYETPLLLNTEYLLEGQTNPANYYLKINNETVISGSGSGTSSANNIILFGNNQGAGLVQPSLIKLYYCKIWNIDGTLLRDLEPALDYDGIPCLYDWVSQSYFYNKGTGQFLYGYNSSTTSYKSTGKKYTQLEYIQSTGTQWIDTGFNVTPNTRLTMSLQHTSFTRQDRFFGSYDSSGLYFCSYINGTSEYAFAYQNNSGNWIDTNKDAKNNSTLNIDFNGKSKNYKLSGAVSYSEDLTSYTATLGCKQTLALFGGRVESGNIAGLAKMKLYYCNIYNDGVLVRNFIPVKDENGVACLFDRISQNFFYNAGTGTFTAGPETGITIQTEYQPISYIESTVSGHQYINTAIQGATKIEMKMKFKKLNPDSSDGNNALIWAENSAAPWNANGIRYALYGSTTEDQRWQIAGGTTYYYNFPDMDTEYILEGDTSVADDTINYSLKINNELVISGSNTAALTSNPLYLFASNQNVFPKQYSIIQLYYCKFWDENNNLIKNLIPVLNYNGQPCLYDTIENKFYENLGQDKFVIENTSSTKVITPGIAREFYHVPRYTTFTSSIAPTSWSGTTTTANAEFSSSNSYGTWKCKMDRQAYDSTHVCWKAFDSDTSTYTRPNPSTGNWVQIYLPTNITICPTKIKIRVRYFKSGSYIEGKNAKTGNWEHLYTHNSSIGNTETNITANITTNNFYSAFAVNGQYYSGANRLYDFKITNGIVSDDRL